jgi:hypothetical protein
MVYKYNMKPTAMVVQFHLRILVPSEFSHYSPSVQFGVYLSIQTDMVSNCKEMLTSDVYFARNITLT